MMDFNHLFDLLDFYISEASHEYTSYEMSRHRQFTFEDLEGSHKTAIKHWMKILDKGVHSFNEELKDIGENILNRSTDDLKEYYESLSEDDKKTFLQLLMKREKELLNLDLERYREYKDKTPEPVTQKPKKQVVQKVSAPAKSQKREATPEEIEAINAKTFLTVKDVEIKYGIASRTQDSYRRRRRDEDPIPYIQNGEGGKIRYEAKKLEEWLKRKK